MTLFSIILALLIEQVRPISGRQVETALAALGRQLEAWFNAGEHRHGLAAWLVGAALPAALVLALQLGFALWAPLLVLPFGVLVLYLTMGFRQYSHYFTDIHVALRLGDLDRARTLLAQWRGHPADRLSPSEIARLSIEEALLHSHRHVFAPLFWFAVLGPVGTVLYRLSLAYAQRWARAADPVTGTFGEFARQAYAVIDWLPLRLTSAGFAVVGDFEDAVYCWRSQAAQWPDSSAGILLASGAGALGVRLGLPLHDATAATDRPELGLGEEADTDFMQSTIGLVWRTLVLGLLLLALVWVANWLG